jgi:hypothetical protein
VPAGLGDDGNVKLSRSVVSVQVTGELVVALEAVLKVIQKKKIRFSRQGKPAGSLPCLKLGFVTWESKSPGRPLRFWSDYAELCYVNESC